MNSGPFLFSFSLRSFEQLDAALRKSLRVFSTQADPQFAVGNPC